MTIAKIIEKALNAAVHQKEYPLADIAQHTEHDIRSFLGHFPKEGLTFGQAVEAAKQGKKVARTGWNGKGMYLQLQVVDEHSKMQHNYIYMSDVNGKFFPWNPNNLDMLAEDWCVVD